MHVITRKRLNEFADLYPYSHSSLSHWYRTIKPARVENFAELKRLFPSADQEDRLTVFNVRRIAAIHYNRQKVYLRAVLTHAEYDMGKWKE